MNVTTATHGNLALKDNQENFLVLVQKPETTPCPSALHEPYARFEGQNGHVFDVLEYGNECRVFQSTLSAVTYCMEVQTEVIGNQVTTISSINGRFVSRCDYLVYPRYAGMGRYIDRAEQAIAGAYEHLQSLVLSGRA